MYMKDVHEWSGDDVHDLIHLVRAAYDAVLEKHAEAPEIERCLSEALEEFVSETGSRCPSTLASTFTHEHIATDPAGRTLWLNKFGGDVWVEDWLGDIRKGLASDTPPTETEHSYWLHHLDLLEDAGVDVGDLRDRVTSCEVSD